MADLLAEWRTARERYSEAQALGRPARECNKLIERVWALERKIAAHPELRPSIVEMCSQANAPADRLGAALVREYWDRDGAALTFDSIVRESGAVLARPVTFEEILRIPGLHIGEPVWTAATCLANIDQGSGNASAFQQQSPAEARTVPARELDAAEQVHDLAENGGIDHAFHVAGHRFSDAANALQSLGEPSAAEILRGLLQLCGTSLVHADEREAELARHEDVVIEDFVQRYAARAEAIRVALDNVQEAP